MVLESLGKNGSSIAAIMREKEAQTDPQQQVKESIGSGPFVFAKDQWVPSKADGDFIQSLMAPCWERGKFASWIAPPKIGIDNKGGDFEYVKIHQA